MTGQREANAARRRQHDREQRRLAGRPYTGQTRGWVVTNTWRTARGNAATSYWYGPAHGFGTTSGPLNYCARVWRTRADAEEALAIIYGGPDQWRPQGYEPASIARLETKGEPR